MWGGVLSFVRQGLRRRPKRRTARVLGESAALGDDTATAAGYDDVAAPREVPGALLARAVLAMARGAVGLDDGEGGAEEAWAAASGWQPARAAEEVRHLMARESLRYVIYA